MADPMCPAEVMAKAAWQCLRDRWSLSEEEMPPAWEDLDEFERQSSIEDMSAALRALAEMYHPIHGERAFTVLPMYEELCALGEGEKQ